LLDRRLADALRRAEDAQQRPAPLGTDARQVADRGVGLPRRAQVAVVGDREPVRLVAQPLDEVERARGWRQYDRVRSAGQEQLLALLREPGERQGGAPPPVEDLPGL